MLSKTGMKIVTIPENYYIIFFPLSCLSADYIFKIAPVVMDVNVLRRFNCFQEFKCQVVKFN